MDATAAAHKLDNEPAAIAEALRGHVAAGNVVLPTLPDLALQINDLTQSDKATAANVSAAIARDPAIAARIIQSANSAYSASRNRAQSVQAAVTRLGLQYTRSLVNRISLEQMFLASSPLLQRIARDTWTRSLGVAALSEAIARERTDLPADTAMLAGLLHRIGSLPLIRIADENLHLVEDEAAFTAAVEQLHPSLGQMLLKRWQFPPLFHDIPVAASHAQRFHAGAADLPDVVVAAKYGWSIDRDAEAEPTLSALDRLGLVPGVNFLERNELSEAFERASERLAI